MSAGTQRGKCRSRPKNSSHDDALAVRLSITLLLDHGRDWSSLPELVELIGPRNAMKVVLAFGGLTLKIPPFSRLVQCLNEASAAMAVFKGKSVREASKTHNVPEEHVKRVYEALLVNKKAHDKISSEIDEQDDKDYIYDVTNGV